VVELSSPKAAPPDSLIAPCKSPTDLQGPQDSSSVAKNWFEDRAALSECKLQKGAVVKFYHDLNEGLSSK
jgi:hypothetical protein